MLSGFSFRLAFVFSVNSLNLSGFPLTSFHLFEDNFVRRSILKNWKPLFRLPLIAKRCDVINVELKTHYLLFRGFMFLCGQSSKNITKYFFKKCFFRTHFAINLFYLPNLKCEQTMEQEPHRALWINEIKQKKSYVTVKRKISCQ